MYRDTPLGGISSGNAGKQGRATASRVPALTAMVAVLQELNDLLLDAEDGSPVPKLQVVEERGKQGRGTSLHVSPSPASACHPHASTSPLPLTDPGYISPSRHMATSFFLHYIYIYISSL